MLATLALVISLAIADSINPVTIAIAVYLASTRNPRRRLAGYALGVFATYLTGGVIFVLAPGGLLHAIAAGSHTRVFHVASIAIGTVVIGFALVLWSRRRRLASLELPPWALKTKSSVVLGAAVTAVDLPTAFPYFAAIGAILSSGVPLPGQALMMVIFNVLYVAPLLAVLVLHTLLGERAEPLLLQARVVIARLSPIVLALLTLGAGIFLVIRGVNGLNS